MRLGILVALLVFVALFALFWNYKKWQWSVVKMGVIAGGCAILSGGLVSGLIYILILIG